MYRPRALEEDHHRVIAAALRPPAEWRRLAGRPSTWLKTTDDDLQSLNFRGSTTWLGGRQEESILVHFPASNAQ